MDALYSLPVMFRVFPVVKRKENTAVNNTIGAWTSCIFFEDWELPFEVGAR